MNSSNALLLVAQFSDTASLGQLDTLHRLSHSVRTDILKQRFGLMDRITRAIPIFLELLQTSFLKHELRVQRRATQAEMAIRGVI